MRTRDTRTSCPSCRQTTPSSNLSTWPGTRSLLLPLDPSGHPARALRVSGPPTSTPPRDCSSDSRRHSRPRALRRRRRRRLISTGRGCGGPPSPIDPSFHRGATVAVTTRAPSRRRRRRRLHRGRPVGTVRVSASGRATCTGSEKGWLRCPRPHRRLSLRWWSVHEPGPTRRENRPSRSRAVRAVPSSSAPRTTFARPNQRRHRRHRHRQRGAVQGSNRTETGAARRLLPSRDCGRVHVAGRDPNGRGRGRDP